MTYFCNGKAACKNFSANQPSRLISIVVLVKKAMLSKQVQCNVSVCKTSLQPLQKWAVLALVVPWFRNVFRTILRFLGEEERKDSV